MCTERLKMMFNEILLNQISCDEMTKRDNLLREEIRKNRELLSQCTDALGNVRPEIDAKNDILWDYNITIETNLNEQKILTEKIQEMREERERMSKELVEVNDTVMRERETLTERAFEFCNEFGVSGQFHQRWKQNCITNEALKKQKTEIESQIKSLHQEVMECDAIDEDERKSIVADIQFLQRRNKQLIKENLSLKNKFSQFEEEIRVLNDVPNVDTKFRRIKEQIETLRNENQLNSIPKPNTLVNKQTIFPKSNINIMSPFVSKREINNSEVSKVMPSQMSNINKRVANSETKSTVTSTDVSFDSSQSSSQSLWLKNLKRKWSKEK